MVSLILFSCKANNEHKKLGDAGKFERAAASLNSSLKDVTDLSFIDLRSDTWVYESSQTRQRISFRYLLYSDSIVKQDTLEIAINRALNFSNYNQPLEAHTLKFFNADYTSDFFVVKLKSKDQTDSQLMTTENDSFYLDILTDKTIEGTLKFDGLVIKISEGY